MVRPPLFVWQLIETPCIFYVLYRETVEDHSPTDKKTNTSSLELLALDTASLSILTDRLHTMSEGCVARTHTLLELLLSETGLMNN